MTPRRKVSPTPLPRSPTSRSTTSRAIAPASVAPRSTYAGVIDRARALGMFALVTIAPLGAMAGSVAACGGARPAEARLASPSPYVPPVDSIAPPASAAAPPGSTAPPTNGPEQK